MIARNGPMSVYFTRYAGGEECPRASQQNLRDEHAPRFSCAAETRANDEITLPGQDWLQQLMHFAGDVAAVSIHEDQDDSVGRSRSGGTCPSIAPLG